MEALVDKLCNRFAGVNGIICSLLQSKYTEYVCCLCVLPLMANQLPTTQPVYLKTHEINKLS